MPLSRIARVINNKELEVSASCQHDIQKNTSYEKHVVQTNESSMIALYSSEIDQTDVF